MKLTFKAHKKAVGSFAFICLFSAATCAFITLASMKQGDGSFALNMITKANESSTYLEQTAKNNVKTIFVLSKNTTKPSRFQTIKPLAGLPSQFVFAMVFLPLTIIFFTRICPMQDYGCISIRKIE